MGGNSGSGSGNGGGSRNNNDDDTDNGLQPPPPIPSGPPGICKELNSSARVGVLASSAINNTGLTRCTGDMDLFPGTFINGFPTIVSPARAHLGDSIAGQALVDAKMAFSILSNGPGTTIPSELGGVTLFAGVYTITSAAQLTGVLTLNALGNLYARWVFRIESDLEITSDSSVVIIDDPTPPTARDPFGLSAGCGIFWVVGGDATIGARTIPFIGTILAAGSIRVGTDARVQGRLLSSLRSDGIVNLDSNYITAPTCDCPLF